MKKSSSNIKNLISKIIAMGVQFLSTMLLTRLIVGSFSGEGNGYYQLSNDFVNYAQIISIALNSMASRFITISYHQRDKKEVNTYFNSTLFANIILAISLIVPIGIIVLNLQNIINISPEMVGDVKILFLLMLFNFTITIITTVFGVSTFANNRVDLDSYRIIESTVLKVAIAYFFVSVLHLPIWSISVATIIATLYIFTMNMFYTKKLMPDVEIFKLKYFDKSHVRTLLSSGVWNSFTKVGAIFLGGLDLLIANIFVSTKAMGMLSISKTVPKYILTAMGSVASVFTPSIMIAYASEEKVNVVETIRKGIMICSLLAIPMEVIVITLGQRLFTLWVPTENASVLQMLSAISIAGYIIILPLEPVWSVFTATNKVKISSIYLTIESVAVILTVFLLLHITDNELTQMIIISGVSSVFELIRGLTFLPIVSAKLLNLPMTTFYKTIIRVFGTFILSLLVIFVINLFIPQGTSWLQLIFLGVLEIIICTFTSLFVLFNREERQMTMKKLIARFIHE